MHGNKRLDSIIRDFAENPIFLSMLCIYNHVLAVGGGSGGCKLIPDLGLGFLWPCNIYGGPGTPARCTGVLILMGVRLNKHKCLFSFFCALCCYQNSNIISLVAIKVNSTGAIINFNLSFIFKIESEKMIE